MTKRSGSDAHEKLHIARVLPRAMEAGAVWFADAVRRWPANGWWTPRWPRPAPAAGESPLTARERDVLIAARLYLAEGTVRNYLSGATTKTGTRNRMEALRVADERGWL